MKVETFQAMGAVPVKDGIVFSMERKNNEEASLLLYKKGSKEVIQEIPFPATNTIGDIVCVKAEKIASARYEYNFCIDGKVTLDPYAKVLVGTGKFGEEHPEGHEVRCAMIAGNYDWEDDRKPQIAYEDAVMYSFHAGLQNNVIPVCVIREPSLESPRRQNISKSLASIRSS